MVNDPISNMLNMAKNAGNASHESITVPFSNLKFAIAQCLEKNGYVSAVAKKTKKGMPALELTLSYVAGAPRIKGIDRVSKPSKRVYVSTKEIRSVRNGHGLLILSTPKGILTDKEARKELVGGEALFKIW